MTAPKAMIFTSDCVDVIQMETVPWLEQFWVVTRDCVSRCYNSVHCPNWQRAVKAMGEWAEEAVPEWQAEDGAEFLLSRTVLHEAQALRPHDHWAWEALAQGPVAVRAGGFLSMGLELGDVAYAVCTDELREQIMAVEGFPADHPNLHWRRAEDMIAVMTGPDGKITVDTVRAGYPHSPLAKFANTKVWVFTSHLYLLQDRWPEAMAVEAGLNELIQQYDLSIACAVPDQTPRVCHDYETLCQQHARTVVV